jgi:NAD(P)H-flavin reductase
MSDKKKKELDLATKLKEEEEMDMDFITLEFDGEDVECAIIDEFELNGKKYMVLLPEDEEDAYIYSFEEDEEGEITLSNLDEDEFKIAVEFYTKRAEADE